MPSPKAVKVNLAAQIFRDDPWTEFRKLRDMGPVIRMRVPFMGKLWGATNFEVVNEVLKDSTAFVRDPKNAGRSTFVNWQWMIPKSIMAVANNMLGADGQRHRRLRSLVDQAFARRQVDEMSTRMETIAREQLDLAQAQIGADGTLDLLKHFAQPFPLTVICELLGLPREDREKFRTWFAPFSTVRNIFGIFKLSGGMRKIVRYLKEQFEIVRKQPGQGLMSELVQAELEGDRLNEDELISMVFILLVAGHETTVHLISNSFYCLEKFPEIRNQVCTDWSRADAVIEEVLRYASPLQFTKPRFVAADMEFHGQNLKQGELIIPIVACANTDPARFERPDEFVMDRDQNFHMSFGSGPHTCLGMKLARTETRIALSAVYERWPDLKPAFDLKHCDWSKRVGTRGFKSFVIQT